GAGVPWRSALWRFLLAVPVVVRAQRPAVRIASDDSRQATFPPCGAAGMAGLAQARQLDAHQVAGRVAGVVVHLSGHGHQPGALAVLAQREAFKLQSADGPPLRSEEHTSELQSRENLVCRILLEKKKPR